MTAPPWLAALLAAVMLLIAAGSLARLVLWRVRGRAAEPEADAVHVLMGVAMAGMFEPAISPVPGPAWRIVFGAAAGWFAWRAVRAFRHSLHASGPSPRTGGWRCAHPAPHSVECAAMVYMLIPADAASQVPSTAMPGMAGAAPAANPAVAIVLALYMLGYIMWTADRMTGQPRNAVARDDWRRARAAEPACQPETVGARTKDAALAPRAAACSKIAMSLAMGYMLLTML